MVWKATAVVFVTACVALGLLRASATLEPPYPRDGAARAALQNSSVHDFLAANAWGHTSVIALDAEHWRVTWWDGPREVLDAAVNAYGDVDAIERHHKTVNPPGAALLWNPAVLCLFALLFCFATGAARLLSSRNLDAVVLAAGITASAVLLDQRLVGAHVFVGALTLLYLAARCARVAFGAHPESAEDRPLYRRLFARTDPVRLLGWISAGALAAGLVLILTSEGASDVAFAGMAGATLLSHGVSPYGHVTQEVVHGDTYPLLTYILYLPFAAISPVKDGFDSLDGALWLNAIALIAAAGLLARQARSLTPALAWMTFPPVLLAASGGGNDVPTALLVVAALTTAAETGAVSWLAIAGWAKVGPALALVAWFARLRGKAMSRAAAAAVAVLAIGLAALVIVGGGDAIDRATRAMRFQFERGSWFSVWQQLGSPALQVGFQAATIAFAVFGVLTLRRRGSWRQCAAFAAALLLLVQVGANYWTFAYLAWVLPFILVALFPPERRGSPHPAPSAP
ncbi:MAG: hypothetical protein QOJ29_1588 [Thermoleophilaceae bacterium]|jgi:hypothetical protein|nr:hypothetical protein [Thermoleophilaceae bacterium]